VVSRDERAHALELGLPPRKLVLIENGIDLRVPAEIARARARARAELGLAESDLVVGFLGRLCAQKAPELAVRVFRRVHDAMPAVRPVLVGDGPDGDHVRGLIGELGLEDVVRVVPRALGRDTIPAFDVFLMSSRYEGFPYVLLEALESGCAVVTTQVGGAVDCVEDGVNGFVVQARDEDARVEALAARVLAACGDPARLREMRVRSRVRSALFSLDRTISRTVDVYHALHAHA
jgi:glycosyltransferase involved in cell wall biosynthesis